MSKINIKTSKNVYPMIYKQKGKNNVKYRK